MAEEYTPQQYREAALKWAEKLGLLAYGPNEINYWAVIDYIATYESGWRGIQSSVLDPAGPGGREDSWGPFQLLRVAGLGGDKTPKELLKPDTNAEIALKKIKEMLDQGYDIDTATWDWAVTHDVDMEWVLANPGQSPAPGQAGTAAAAPLTPPAGVAGELVPPNMADFMVPSDPLDPNSPKILDYERYYAAVSAFQLLEAGVPSTDPSEIDYLNASVDLIAMQLQGEAIDVSKADLELQKRLGALQEAGRTYRELAPYALPKGTEFIPGGGKGGLYEKLGLGTMPAATTRVNPLAIALAAMGPTPEMGPTPATSFEAALAGAQQLRTGMGAAPATVAPAAAPSHLEAALATAAPTVLEPEVEPPGGWVTPAAGEPSGFPDFPPPAGAGGGPPIGTLSPEEADRIAQIILAILGSFGGGRQLSTPAPY